MLGSRPKKMMNMYIYDILRRNTDAEHPMTQREIQKRLESEYDMTVDRLGVYVTTGVAAATGPGAPQPAGNSLADLIRAIHL